MFDPSPKNMEKTTIFGKILIFSGTILKADRKQFWQTLRTYFEKLRNWLNKSPNVRMKIKKKCFSLVTCSLLNAVKKIAVFRTFFEEKFFCGTTFSSECSCVLLKNVPLDSQNAAKRAESALNSFCHCPNVFRSKPEKQKRLFVKTSFSSKCFFWAHRTEVWPDWQLFYAKSRKKFSCKS